MPSRRKTLQLIGSTATLGTVSGCIGSFHFQSGSIDIDIENRDDQPHTVNVAFESKNESIFSNQYTVTAGEEITVSDAVEAGEYQVTVKLDSTDPEIVDFHMSGCHSNTLSAIIYKDGEMGAGVLDEC